MNQIERHRWPLIMPALCELDNIENSVALGNGRVGANHAQIISNR